mmetsp:Transcript_6750/g.10858  ORF Transcript_6750/g.10858 Transcript_6750/m.10858 type:complete len:86 (-) Transcript_6750:12-269(-)
MKRKKKKKGRRQSKPGPRMAQLERVQLVQQYGEQINQFLTEEGFRKQGDEDSMDDLNYDITIEDQADSSDEGTLKPSPGLWTVRR